MNSPLSPAPLGDTYQSTSMLLMVRPDCFGHNPQTAATNPLQRGGDLDPAQVAVQALREFDGVVAALDRLGIPPAVLPGPPGRGTPDAVFPNNWFTTHADGTVVLYPMQATNRRGERQEAALLSLAGARGLRVARVLDLSALEHRGAFLEGTGSLVLDRRQGLAFAALSPRTRGPALEEFAARTGYRILAFDSDIGGSGPAYHTNVMLAVGGQWALLCAEAVAGRAQRRALHEALAAPGRTILEISRDQMGSFAANCLEVRTPAGPATLMSTRALASFTATQRRKLERHSMLCPVDVRTIEQVGGGSVRCMLAELFLPPADALAGGPVAGDHH